MKLEKREYICDVCKQIFLRRRYFVQHFRKHTRRIDKDKNDNTTSLTDLLPRSWKYVTKSYEPQPQNKNFTATILVLELCTADQVKEWMKEFMNINKCNYVLKHLDTRESRFAKSKHVYMCRYLNRRSNGSSCQSCIRIVIRRNWENSAYFAVINIKYVHNHSPDCAAILRYRSPSEEVQDYFRSMFENGFSPSQAFNSYKQHLYEQHSSKYDSVVADRAVCPDQRWVYYFYQKMLKQKSGPSPTEQMLITVKDSVDEFNSSCKEKICHFKQVNDNHFVIVTLTPLMRRGLHLPNAGESIFINHESNVSRLDLHVYLIFTACVVGGIPIGVIITSENSFEILVEGFKLYRSLVDEKSFGGLNNGPEIIMTDDYCTLKNALEITFPTSHVFLSIFQVLECGWKWLWKLENGIDSKYRKSFYNYLQRMMYCTQPELLEIIFGDLLADGNAEKHSNFLNYVTELYARKNEWAICLQDLSCDKQNVKYVIEKTMKVSKEKIFKKMRSYNPAQLFHYLVNGFNSYYEQKLLDVAVNNVYNFLNQNNTINQELVAKYKMECVTDSVIMLTNIKKNMHYVVNKDIGACSCYLGEAGLSCKHLGVINFCFNLKSENDYCISGEEKQQFYYVATGCEGAGENLITETVSQESSDFFDKDDKADDFDLVEEVVVFIEDGESMRMEDEENKTEFDSNINNLRDNFENLVRRLESSRTVFNESIVRLNEKLQLLAQEDDSSLMSALMHFAGDEVREENIFVT